MFVLTIDQIGSRKGGDEVPALLDALNEYDMVREFERTAGDEVQGVTDEASVVRWISLKLLRDGGWHIGIGVGDAELGSSARAGTGPAYLHAREAVDRTKSLNRFSPSIAVGGDGEDVTAAESVLRAVGFIFANRTDAQWEAIDAHRGGATVKEIAASLGVSVEAVSQRRGHGGQVVEESLWPTIDLLLGRSA
ncbi:MAG: hypothetical protein QMB98_04255 [Flaviflexus sp.]|uniref:hypothetical protein n=1 Tax=Flaviflexus sp. TaxID=1969482 RepID=UPI00352DD771